MLLAPRSMLLEDQTDQIDERNENMTNENLTPAPFKIHASDLPGV